MNPNKIRFENLIIKYQSISLDCKKYAATILLTFDINGALPSVRFFLVKIFAIAFCGFANVFC